MLEGAGGWHYIRRQGKDGQELKAKIKARQREIEMGGARPSESRGLTVEKWMAQWLASMRSQLSRKSIRSYEQLNRLYVLPSVGKIMLRKLTSADVIGMLSDMQARGLSPTTCKDALSILRAGLQAAINRQPPILTHNPCAGVKPPPKGPKDKRVFTSDQIEAFLNAAMSEKGGRYGPMVALLLCTGVRISEALGWLWGDVHMDAKPEPLIMIHRSLEWGSPERDGYENRIVKAAEWYHSSLKSTSAIRAIPLSKPAIRALEAIRIEQSTGRRVRVNHNMIFTSETGAPARERNVTRALAEILKVAKLPPMGLHDLRRSFGTHLANTGTPMHVLQKLMGHSSIIVTSEHYLGVLDMEAAKSVKAFDVHGGADVSAGRG